MATATITQISAQDGIKREASMQPAVHRPDVPVPDHGKFTAATALACVEAQYFLGLRSDTYLRKDPDGHRIVTEGAQRVIREPETREDVQLAARRRARRSSNAGRGSTQSSRRSCTRTVGVSPPRSPADPDTHLGGFRPLPASLVIEWERFFKVPDGPEPAMRSMRINTQLAEALRSVRRAARRWPA